MTSFTQYFLLIGSFYLLKSHYHYRNILPSKIIKPAIIEDNNLIYRNSKCNRKIKISPETISEMINLIQQKNKLLNIEFRLDYKRRLSYWPEEDKIVITLLDIYEFKKDNKKFKKLLNIYEYYWQNRFLLYLKRKLNICFSFYVLGFSVFNRLDKNLLISYGLWMTIIIYYSYYFEKQAEKYAFIEQKKERKI